MKITPHPYQRTPHLGTVTKPTNAFKRFKVDRIFCTQYASYRLWPQKCSYTSWSFIPRSPIGVCVCVCDRETSKVRILAPYCGVAPQKTKLQFLLSLYIFFTYSQCLFVLVIFKNSSPHRSIPALGPTHPRVRWVQGFSSGVKQSGRDVDNCYRLSPLVPTSPFTGLAVSN
jgi:hypothetical protein